MSRAMWTLWQTGLRVVSVVAFLSAIVACVERSPPAAPPVAASTPGQPRPAGQRFDPMPPGVSVVNEVKICVPGARAARPWPKLTNWQQNVQSTLQRQVGGEWQAITAISPDLDKRCLGVNNLFCIKNGGTPWDGSVAQDCDEHSFFSDSVYSIRAAIRLYRTYWFQHRLRTPVEIAERYASHEDCLGSSAGRLPGGGCEKYNNPCDYGGSMARALGIAEGQRIPFFSPGAPRTAPINRNAVDALLTVKLRYEAGIQGYRVNPAVVTRAIELEQNSPLSAPRPPEAHWHGECRGGSFFPTAKKVPDPRD